MSFEKLKSDFKRMVKLSKKPSRTEFWISIRICTLGILLVGLVAFIIKLIFTLVVGITPPTS